MPQSAIGTVYLKVAQLDKLAAFYQDIIGLQVHQREGDTLYLGAGGDDLLALTETPDGKHYRGTTGLYHFAILTPSRYDLARSLKRLAETRTRLQGMSDHFVSEALYLADPEGNGIEIYRDRPRSEWYENGEFKLGTVALDVEGVLSALEDKDVPWTGLHPDTVIGHIHLHVSSVPEAEDFYRNMLAMDVMVNMGSATFMSYEGYHHHLGANIWGGRVPPPADALGLDKYIVRVPDKALLDTIQGRLDEAHISPTKQDGGYLVSDPSQNRVLLV